MLVISTREFREKQSKYLGMVSSGEDIVLKSRKEGSFKIVPIKRDDSLMSKEEFYAKLDKSIRQIEEGKLYTLDMNKVDEFLGL